MDRKSLDDLLKSNPGRFYVYQLSKPDGMPFYIGKGIGRRVFNHETEAVGPGKSHKLNTIRLMKSLGYSIDYLVVEFFDCEATCHEREIYEIRRVGRHDLGSGPLTNLTDGGEGTTGLSEETLARIDFNLHSTDAPGDRGIANRFFHELCGSVRSVPVRPINEISKPRPLSAVSRTNRAPTIRQAAALAASAIANRVMIEPGALIPRRLSVNDTPMIVEFGVSKDILQSGMAIFMHTPSKDQESLALTELGYEATCGLLDAAMLRSAGILMPLLSSNNSFKPIPLCGPAQFRR